MGLGFIGFKYYTKPAPAMAVEALAVFQNPEKRVKKITLRDGSRVWLQENSTLTVADDFNQTKRRVTLVGEAFFEVAKDKYRPFEIFSGNITTRVLGTSFHIKAYEKDATVEVSVVTGRVSVLTPDSGKMTGNRAGKLAGAQGQVIVWPNQKVTYTKAKEHLVKKEISDKGRRMVWAKASLSFKDTPIRQVVKTLNQYFATDIKLANVNLNNCSIQGDFTNQNLPEILEAICKIIEAEYEFYKNEIIITGEGCPLIN
jgi:ferric-dicitrate binding protein FerR (iron transport regulator)